MIKVVAAVIEQNGKVLIARRRPGKSQAGKWEFPGGKLEEGESPEECLQRELAEEFQITVTVGAYICSTQYRYEHGEIELIAYHVEYQSGNFVLSDHDRIEWISPSDYENYEFSAADVPIVQKLMQ